MPQRSRFLIVVSLVVLAVIILLPSFTVRAILAGLILLVAVVWLIKTLATKTEQATATRTNANQAAVPETFARAKLFEATMNGMREGLIVVDKEMRVVVSNTAAHQLFSLSRGKLDTQRLTELTRNPAIYSAFLDALQGTERSGVKVETHGPERLVFDLRVVPLGANGNAGVSAEGALGVFIDVTRMEKLEQVRQEFLSNVSHELRTPLTAILAFIETLEGGAINDQEASQRFLSIIRRNATRMHDLIDDTLELSAIESGKVQVRAVQVELYPIVEEVISSLANKAVEQSVIVLNKVAPEATVYADARRLEQMLTNLVENAIKFNRENGTVSISYQKETSAASTSGSSVARPRSFVIVDDTGEGIPAQHLGRLFERFYRVDRARSREMGGLGLGLAIVKHLARAHGGEVTVSSEVGKGSTFTIELPRDEGMINN